MFLDTSTIQEIRIVTPREGGTSVRFTLKTGAWFELRAVAGGAVVTTVALDGAVAVSRASFDLNTEDGARRKPAKKAVVKKATKASMRNSRK
jgi:hypothetical protein